MPNRVPIKAAKELAEKYDLDQVIITAWDGERMHVVTYGRSLEDCKQAAQGGNFVKKALGFPEELCNEVPSRARRKDG